MKLLHRLFLARDPDLVVFRMGVGWLAIIAFFLVLGALS